MQTYDAYLRVPGLELKSMPMRINGMGWTSAAPQLLSTVLIQLRVLHDIPAGTLSEMVIRAPEGVMYSEQQSSVTIVPVSLPLRAGKPTAVAGDLLYLNLDDQQVIEERLYNIH